jgi:hypothetical protein
MKPSWRLRVETGKTLRRVIGGALVSLDEFHARAKPTGSKTPSARFIQPNGPAPPATRTNEETPTPAVRPTKAGKADDEGRAVGESDGRVLVLRPDHARSPQPGHANRRKIIDRCAHELKK